MSILVSVFMPIQLAYHQTAMACGDAIPSAEERNEIETENA